jgi:hypothetical protein
VKDEIERRAGRLLLAVGVIDENLVEILVDLPEPAGVGFCLQVKHELMLKVECGRTKGER